MSKAKKDSFVLVNLKDDKTKDLTQTLSNKTCRKILEYLAEHEDATESKISKELDVALSTVHYNLKLLEKNNLIIAEEFHYSKKGKEVNHYKLANKLIIIAPKEIKSSWKEKLMKIIPFIAGIGIIGIIIKLFSKSTELTTKNEFATEGARIMQDEAIQTTKTPSLLSNILNYKITWFVFGAIATAVIYLLVRLIIKQKNKR